MTLLDQNSSSTHLRNDLAIASHFADLLKATKENKNESNDDSEEINETLTNIWYLNSPQAQILRQHLLIGDLETFHCKLDEIDNIYDEFHLRCLFIEYHPSSNNYHCMIKRCQEIISHEKRQRFSCDLISLLASALYSSNQSLALKLIKEIPGSKFSINSHLIFHTRTKEKAGFQELAISLIKDLDGCLRNILPKHQRWDDIDDVFYETPYPESSFYQLVIALRKHSSLKLLKDLYSKSYLDNFEKMTVAFALVHVLIQHKEVNEANTILNDIRTEIYSDPDNYQWQFDELMEAYIRLDQVSNFEKTLYDFMHFGIFNPVSIAYLLEKSLALINQHSGPKSTFNLLHNLAKEQLAVMSHFRVIDDAPENEDWPNDTFLLIEGHEHHGNFHASHLAHGCFLLACSTRERDLWDDQMKIFHPFLSNHTMFKSYLNASEANWNNPPN